jgi:transmembrane 9 superfamily protein 2/4
MQTLEEAQEESGWKLVQETCSARPPSGVQILAMTLCTMVCALFGLASYGNRDGLLTTLLILFVFMGSFAGYCSARVYKLFGGKEWKKNTVMTAMFYPGVMGSIFLFINSFVAYYGSSAAAPLTTLFVLILLWFELFTIISAMCVTHRYVSECVFHRYA